MKALKRYLLLLLTFLILCGIYRAFFSHHGPVPCLPSFSSQSSNTGTNYLSGRKSYYTLETHKKFFYSYSVQNVPQNATKAHAACHMGKCFDFSRCKQSGENVKIYIYPNDGQNASPTFMKIINFIKNSKYYEPDPNKGKQMELLLLNQSTFKLLTLLSSLPLHFGYRYTRSRSPFSGFQGTLKISLLFLLMFLFILFRNMGKTNPC